MLVLAFAVLSCIQNGIKPLLIPGAPLTIAEGFSEEKINASMRYSTDFAKESPFQVLEKLASFKIPAGNGPLVLGSTLQNNFSWVYVALVNKQKKTLKTSLVTEHLRCDKLELFHVIGKKATLIGEVDRSTPISERSYPYNDFAFAIDLPPSDTTYLLIRSTRLLGATELDFRLFEEKNFLQHQYLFTIWNAFNVSSVLVIALLSLLIGILYRNRLMTFFGTVSVCVFMLYAYVHNYWDGLPYPVFTGVQNYNTGGFLSFLLNALFHPYGYEVLKNYNINAPVYKKIAAVLLALNALMALLMLISVPFIDVLYIYSFTLFAVLNIGCFVCVAYMVYMQTGQKWLLSIVALAFGPTMINLPLNLFNFSERFYATFTRPYITLATAMMAYFTLKQLLYQLTSKAELERRLTGIKLSMDDMRKEEVQKIGRNLHDQLGNTLASSLGYLNARQVDLGKVQMLVNEAIKEIRFMSHNLVKDDNLLLTEKIDNMVDRFNDFSDISFHFLDYSEGKVNGLSILKQQNIYLVIQEIFTNAIKHSHAQELTIQAFSQNNMVQISIEDDGVGFDVKTNTKGLGVKNMFKRAELGSFSLTIDSSPGNGISIIIETNYED